MLKMNFLNVGKGNCVIINFPNDKLTIIDIDNSHIDDKNDMNIDDISVDTNRIIEEFLNN